MNRRMIRHIGQHPPEHEILGSCEQRGSQEEQDVLRDEYVDVLVLVDGGHAAAEAGDPDAAGEDHGVAVAFVAVAREALVGHQSAAGEEADSKEDGEGFYGCVGVEGPGVVVVGGGVAGRHFWGLTWIN